MRQLKFSVFLLFILKQKNEENHFIPNCRYVADYQLPTGL